jgi:hypothetical protein
MQGAIAHSVSNDAIKLHPVSYSFPLMLPIMYEM